jgi:uncharacterized membrane protein HdeD (DUF308 family)
MTTQAPPTKLLDLWKPTLVSGALAVILGGVVVLWRDMSIEVAAILLGVYLVASAAVPAFIGFTLAAVVGICLVVLGVLEIISSYEIRLSEKEFIRIKTGTTDRS